MIRIPSRIWDFKSYYAVVLRCSKTNSGRSYYKKYIFEKHTKAQLIERLNFLVVFLKGEFRNIEVFNVTLSNRNDMDVKLKLAGYEKITLTTVFE